MASTIDDGSRPFGSEWTIYRSYERSSASGQSYAYPNPFSPVQSPVRIHYFSGGTMDRSVSIEIFDFGMNRVRTLVLNASRRGSAEYDEIWDGRNDAGKIVANGVYIYRLRIDTDEPAFGKILVLQ
jgi:hypothetical protein